MEAFRRCAQALALLPIYMMSVLPRWHTHLPSGAAAAKTPATSTARHGPYLLVRRYVCGQNITEHNPACAIALRSRFSARDLFGQTGAPRWSQDTPPKGKVCGS